MTFYIYIFFSWYKNEYYERKKYYERKREIILNRAKDYYEKKYRKIKRASKR